MKYVYGLFISSFAALGVHHYPRSLHTQYLSVAQQSRPQAVRHSIWTQSRFRCESGPAAAPLKDLQRALNDAKFPPGSSFI